jgi:hypothetical protein
MTVNGKIKIDSNWVVACIYALPLIFTMPDWYVYVVGTTLLLHLTLMAMFILVCFIILYNRDFFARKSEKIVNMTSTNIYNELVVPLIICTVLSVMGWTFGAALYAVLMLVLITVTPRVKRLYQ